jgi:hypothetical protein
MAFDINVGGVYSGRTNHALHLYVRRDQTDAANNRSSYAWELYAISNTGAATGSWTATVGSFGAQIGSYGSLGNAALDFRSTGRIVLASGTTGWFTHDANGNLSLSIGGNHNNVGIFGTASLPATWFYTDKLNRPPSAPTGASISEVTPTTMRYQFTAGAANGAAIDSHQIQYATDAAFTAGVVTVSATVNTVLTGLTPGTLYYVRARSHNSVGWGSYNAALSQSTLPSTPPSIAVAPAASGLTATLTLTAPGGVSGVTSYDIERRVTGTTSPVTSLNATSSPYTATGLIPGTSYEWRARANIGAYVSPWSDPWVVAVQPNPNTSPGQYFDGSTPDSPSLDYSWTAAANNSTSQATGLGVQGWMTFAEGATVSGGTGAVTQAFGSIVDPPSGTVSARAVFFTDAAAAGFRLGTDVDALARADIVGSTVYVGSIWAQANRVQRLAAALVWINAAGAVLSTSAPGTAVETVSGVPVRLSVTATAPATAEFAAVIVMDVAGTGWALWHGGDILLADGAMITLATLFPYFDGATADSDLYEYNWLGPVNASPSSRTPLDQAVTDALLDPDCPPIPPAPTPPVIDNDCIEEVGIWRRYWASIPASEVSMWLAIVPTVIVSTGSDAARQVRIRYYQNPDNVTPDVFDAAVWEAEQIISYMPPQTDLTIDGVSERVWASVQETPPLAADHLLYGTGGTPATWPTLKCGVAYLISFDAPIEADAGNVSVDVGLTRRF